MVDEIVRLAAGHLAARLSRHALGEMKFDFVGQFRAQINRPSLRQRTERVLARAREHAAAMAPVVSARLYDEQAESREKREERERETRVGEKHGVNAAN